MKQNARALQFLLNLLHFPVNRPDADPDLSGYFCDRHALVPAHQEQKDLSLAGSDVSQTHGPFFMK